MTDSGVHIRLLDRHASVPPKVTRSLILRPVEWNDWFKYATLFRVSYVDSKGNAHEIGQTKIGQRGMRPDSDTIVSPRLSMGVVRELPDDCFSLGQDDEYYTRLSKLGAHVREEALQRLRDIAFDPDLRVSVEDEDVLWVSLLREVTISAVRGKLARLAQGQVRLTEYRFEYEFPKSFQDDSPSIVVEVAPNSKPPTNIHVVIGRNGVGKSTTLNRMSHAFVYPDRNPSFSGRFRWPAADSPGTGTFANMVSVSFSAFDEFDPVLDDLDDESEVTFQHIGLNPQRRVNRGSQVESLDFTEATLEAARSCLRGEKRARWRRALKMIESDPIFAVFDISGHLQHMRNSEKFLAGVSADFATMSSGHKIVFASLTQLVAAVDEKSLVLIDEPESHLHPPLLSSFVRALSDLLINRNGVAIIATHSPVVLQEVPRTCVWKLSRDGNRLRVDPPEIETFGENVGTLTDDVFGLEVAATGFHRMLTEVAMHSDDYEEAVAMFAGQLGFEGRSILRARMAANQSQRQ